MQVRNDLFDSSVGLERGRSKAVEAVWYLVKVSFFLSALPWPSPLKCVLLRLFGAKIGKGVYIKPRVNVHFPWKLQLGDFTWLGEEVWILNFEPVSIGSHCCISQRAFLCGGSHDYRSIDMRYRNAPIVIEDGAWIGAQVFVGPGVRVGKAAVATACSVVTSDLPHGMICSGSPCEPSKPRWSDVDCSCE